MTLFIVFMSKLWRSGTSQSI